VAEKRHLKVPSGRIFCQERRRVNAKSQCHQTRLLSKNVAGAEIESLAGALAQIGDAEACGQLVVSLEETGAASTEKGL
jgi:hypothetical protein